MAVSGSTAYGVYAKSFNLYQTSDERLKDVSSDIDVNFDKLKEIRKVEFSWKGDTSCRKDIGVTAQSLAEAYPRLVTVDGNGYYGVSYDKLSVVSLAAIDKLHDLHLGNADEIEAIKDRLDEIENAMDELKRLLRRG